MGSEFLLFLLPAGIGFILGGFVGYRLGLKKGKWLIAGIGMLIFIGLYVFLQHPLLMPAERAERVEAEENADTIDQTPPPIYLDIQPLGLNVNDFRIRFNQTVAFYFPEQKERLSLPALPIERGLISDTFRYSFDPHITLTAGIQKQSNQIDEITILAAPTLPPQSIRQVQQIAMAATMSVLTHEVTVDALIASLFNEATVHPDQQVVQFIGNLRLTVLMDPMGGFAFTLSRPMNSFFYEEDPYFEAIP